MTRCTPIDAIDRHREPPRTTDLALQENGHYPPLAPTPEVRILLEGLTKVAT